VQESIWRIMHGLFTNSLARKVNMRGLNGKISFLRLQIRDVVIGKFPFFPNMKGVKLFSFEINSLWIQNSGTVTTREASNKTINNKQKTIWWEDLGVRPFAHLSLHQSLKEHSTIFWKWANFTTPQEFRSWVLPFSNPFSRSPGLVVAL